VLFPCRLTLMIGSNRRTQAADHQLNPDSHNTKSRRYSANYGPCRIRALNLSLMTDDVCFGCLRGGCGMMVGIGCKQNTRGLRRRTEPKRAHTGTALLHHICRRYFY